MKEDDAKLVPPASQRGLTEVVRHRYLLSLLVRKEVQIRYRGSVLGWLWSYVKPLLQFVVFYFAVGVFLGMNGRVQYFPIYLLAGITIVTFFNEAFSNGTRSLVDNSALIKKIYLPREMFPIASMLVAAVNALPQILVVMVIALFFGWHPTVLSIAAILFALVMVAVLASGLSLLFGAINVSFRDAESFVEIIVMVAIWASPVMYEWTAVANVVPAWMFDLYRVNPLTSAVELFHYGIWWPLGPDNATPQPGLWMFAGIAFLITLVFLAFGQFVFRRLEGRFAQDL
ncbi:MAG: ABC transporter permease [Microbacterium sp.]